MNNSKWRKVFRALSENYSMVQKCLIKNIGDPKLRELKIPSPENFDQTFSVEGIKDVMLGGPLFFKEIECLEFPKNWETNRIMRDQKLAPKKHQQDIQKIQEIISHLGQFELELSEQKLLLCANKSP